MTTEHPLHHCCDFAGDYELSKLPTMRALERRVLGCDYGGTSWTTREQVDHLAESLELGPGTHLLDVGAGSGWPGLFLSTLTGSEVTLVDLPMNALRQAAERAAAERIDDRVGIVAGSGAALPFSDATFDRISHSDVLCCLPEKLSMLRECRRVATPRARMHFSVIKPAPQISSSDYAAALAGGPPFIDAPDGYEPLLGEAGWETLDYMDVTPQYRASLETLVDGLKADSAALREAFGADEFAAKLQRRVRQVELIERGILQRELFVVTTS